MKDFAFAISMSRRLSGCKRSPTCWLSPASISAPLAGQDCPLYGLGVCYGNLEGAAETLDFLGHAHEPSIVDHFPVAIEKGQA